MSEVASDVSCSEKCEKSVTAQDILKRLEKRVSVYNAKLILNQAMVITGVRRQLNDPLNQEEAKTLCFELIRRGGPAFQVGSAVIRETLQ